MAARKSALLIDTPPQAANIVAVPETTANSGLSLLQGMADRVDPCALAMDQALGSEIRPFSAISRWNNFAWSLAPMVCDLFSLAVKACVEVQLTWLAWVPGYSVPGYSTGLGTGQTDGPRANQTEEQWRAELASQMDHATGAGPVPETVALPCPALQDAAALNISQERLPAAKPVEAEESPEDVEELAMLAGSVA